MPLGQFRQKEHANHEKPLNFPKPFIQVPLYYGRIMQNQHILLNLYRTPSRKYQGRTLHGCALSLSSWQLKRKRVAADPGNVPVRGDCRDIRWWINARLSEIFPETTFSLYGVLFGIPPSPTIVIIVLFSIFIIHCNIELINYYIMFHYSCCILRILLLLFVITLYYYYFYCYCYICLKTYGIDYYSSSQMQYCSRSSWSDRSWRDRETSGLCRPDCSAAFIVYSPSVELARLQQVDVAIDKQMCW